MAFFSWINKMVFGVKHWLGLMVFLCLCSCGQRDGLAPVEELKWREINSHAAQHVVQHGETLYAIAFRYDQDYRQLALSNHLPSPYTLRVGQIIHLHARRKPVAVAHAYHKKLKAHTMQRWPARKYKPVIYSRLSNSGWSWPLQGRIIASYVPLQGRKGIDIAGKKGEKVHAARAGVVAYAGSGLAGYGNLIIIKHDNQYLTAYGNNARNLVREGQHIKAQQTIAEVGVVDRRFWGVHFEIRKTGKPVNPLNYLQKRG